MKYLLKFNNPILLLIVSIGFFNSVLSKNSHKKNVICVTTTIQAAVDQAQPGSTIKIPNRVFTETVNIPTTLSDLTILAEKGAVLDAGFNPFGITSTNSFNLPEPYMTPEVPCPAGQGLKNFTIKGLKIINATVFGLLIVGATNFKICHCDFENNNLYGVFPLCCNGGLISHCTARFSKADAGIYVGTCENVSVRHCTASENLLGIEIENSINCDAQYNECFNNSVGIFVDILPNLPIKKNCQILLAHNNIHDNNVLGTNASVGVPGVEVFPLISPTVAPNVLPTGGIVFFAGGPIVLANNTIFNNAGEGVVFIDIPLRTVGPAEPIVDPVQPRDPALRPQTFVHNITFVKNNMFNNGTAGFFGLPPVDIVIATNNPDRKHTVCLDKNNCLKSGGAAIPSSAVFMDVDPKLPQPFRDQNLPIPGTQQPIVPKKSCHIPSWAKKLLTP